MTTIDPRSPALPALRSRPAGAPSPGQAAGRPAAATGAGAGAGAQGVGPALASRLAAIDRTDPDRRRKAVRVVLEAELARAFGAALLDDPSFPQMLSTVQDQMQDDAQAAAAVEALGERLLAGLVALRPRA